jgi:hypothetical protein
MEHRNCQNCKNDFIIESEDFAFYDKIHVPPPTFCPDCSHQRRLAWRNTHSLHQRIDSISGEKLISIYHPDTKMNIVSQKYWWSDAWDPIDYGKDYDFNKNFFVQWKELMNIIPFQALSNSKAVNSEYCNVAEENYDCYLVSACWKNERTMYSDSITEIKDSSDLYIVHKSDFCYDDVYCYGSYKLLYSEHSDSCADSYFLYDCRGCTNCFMSSNLRNKSYYFNNEQLSKEEYNKRISEIDLGSFNNIKLLKIKFNEIKKNSINKFSHMINSSNSTGDNIERADNCKFCFDVSDGIKDSKYIFWAAKNIYDCYYCNAIGALESSFESYDSGVGGTLCNFDNVVYSCNEVEYSFNCHNSSNLFGCMGLRSKKYCILNKQYTKEEYFEILPKIKQHMMGMPYVDKNGIVYKYGEFFPIELSPFGYNETVAYDFYPIKKEEAIEKGYLWIEKEHKDYSVDFNTEDLPDNIRDINEDLINKNIICENNKNYSRCTSAFRITKSEFDFYKRFNIPIPRKCYQCRHNERFSKRQPLNLWHRQCMCDKQNHNHDGICSNEFETSYAPERPEIVYCEKCYQQEVI